MDTVVIKFKSGDTFYTHRYTDCNVSVLDGTILKIELEEAYIYYPLRCISDVTIVTGEEDSDVYYFRHSQHFQQKL